jgi:hypothetical protein
MSEHSPHQQFTITLTSQGVTTVYTISAPFSLSIAKNGELPVPLPAEPPTGFLTSYTIVLRASGKPGDRIFFLIINETIHISLNFQQYCLLKLLALQMIEDRNKPVNEMGWIRTTMLNGEEPLRLLSQKEIEGLVLEPDLHNKAFYAIRERLRRLHLSDKLIEHSSQTGFRVSTAPDNIRIDTL